MQTDEQQIPTSRSSFAQRAAEKEQEWKQLQQMHEKSLEAALAEKQKVVVEQRKQFQTLKDDFKYNLKLLAERDQELEKLEVTLEQAHARLQEREAETSDLKIRIDDLRMRQAQDQTALEDLQRHYQQRVREKQAEMEEYKQSKDADLKKEQDELEALRRDMQRRIRMMEEELEIQRREMVAGFDDESRRREKEYRSKIDELSSTVLAHEMKVKLLSKELEIVRGASQETSTQLSQSDTRIEDVRKKLKWKEWELSDLRGMKDARITELESNLQQAQQAVKQAEEEFQRRHKELDRYAREREAAVVSLKESQAEAERKLLQEIRRLEGEMETKETERRRQEWEHQDTLKEREILIQKLQEELQEIRGQSDGHLARMSKDMVSKDLVIGSLRDKEKKLRAELECRKEDIERYKKELVIAAEKEQNLERSKVQLDLDWQRRYEDAERTQYAKSEDLIARLTRSRDDAVALTKELERELQQLGDLNRVLVKDRDHAVATLRKHKLPINRDLIPSKDTGSEDILELRQIKVLQAENESLIAVIKDMKREMEEMESQQINTPAETRLERDVCSQMDKLGTTEIKGKVPFTEEYVQALEKECRELKVEKRRLEERLATLAQSMQNDGFWEPAKLGRIQLDIGQSDTIKSHIQSLNDTIGALRAVKVTTAAELRKYQARLSHLEAELNQKQYQPKEKQVEIDQLRYELSVQARRHATEASSLAQRIGQLELQLVEARREGDEYYKGTLQTNLEATTLGRQVSELKMDLAGRGHVKHGGQSALVNQLQREVLNLRSQLDGVQPPTVRDQRMDDGRLQTKLKTAARHISRLARERQQLIEMGNQLRSELALYRPHQPPVQGPHRHGQGGVHGHILTAGRLAKDVSTKLEKLEKLQYALTKQELQYARQRIGQEDKEADVVQVQLSSSSESTPEQTSRNNEGLPSPAPPDLKHPSIESHQLPFRQSESSEGDAPSDSSVNHRQTPLVMSSLGEESMQDVWRLLDDGTSPIFFRSPSPMHRPEQSPIPEEPHPSQPSSQHYLGQSTSGLQVAGMTTHLQDRSKQSAKPQLSSKAAGHLHPKAKPAKQRLRNYAIKDDESIR